MTRGTESGRPNNLQKAAKSCTLPSQVGCFGRNDQGELGIEHSGDIGKVGVKDISTYVVHVRGVERSSIPRRSFFAVELQ